MAHFVVKFQEKPARFGVGFSEETSNFSVGFGAVSVLPSAEVYSGSYEVTPRVDSQVMKTAEKFMKHDMQIKAIPFFEVGNTSGGNTVYIGNEVT